MTRTMPTIIARSQPPGQEVGERARKRSGCSRLDRWPAPGITHSVDRGMARCMASDSAGGVISSCSPTTTSVGAGDARGAPASSRAGPSAATIAASIASGVADSISGAGFLHALRILARVVSPSSFGSIWSATPPAVRARAPRAVDASLARLSACRPAIACRPAPCPLNRDGSCRYIAKVPHTRPSTARRSPPRRVFRRP